MKRNISCDNSFMQSAFKINCGGDSGTCFQYIHKIGNIGNIFLVTVRHLFPTTTHGSTITVGISTETGIRNVNGIIYSPEDYGGQQVDIAVIKIQESLLPSAFFFHREQFFICQEAFFAGFPFGMELNSVGMNNGYPIPVVKKGTISGWNFQHRVVLTATIIRVSQVHPSATMISTLSGHI